jgi:hypothetical protein
MPTGALLPSRCPAATYLTLLCAPPLQRRAYKLQSWTDTEDFLAQLARAGGRLLRGGEPDANTAAKMVLYDWQRGKIPYFAPPPGHVDALPAGPAAPADGAAVADDQVRPAASSTAAYKSLGSNPDLWLMCTI